MRKIKTPFKNSLTSFIASLCAIAIKFFTQRIFLHVLGSEFLGINSLFSSIISMLSIAELGIGSAIIYNLYTPIKNGNSEKIATLMKFYKKAYRYVALTASCIGLAIVPFLHLFTNGVPADVNVYLIYLLFMVGTISSYFLSYYRSMLYADQKNYIISFVHIAYLVILNAIQVLILLTTKNYYLYLGVKILFDILENIIISRVVLKKYPYMAHKNTEPLDHETRHDIALKVKGLLFHRIGGFIINGTDNSIIAYFLGVVTVGFYANYLVIINALESIFGQIIVALVPTVGHILVDKDKNKSFLTFRKVRFVTFLISLFSTTGLLVCTQPFISIWLGAKYLLPISTLLVLSINHFQRIMRNAYLTFKEAAGIYHEDRFVPLIESVINIIASVILVQFIGLPGVFIGTILSSLVLWCYSYPKYVYKPLFGRSYSRYAIETIAYFAIFAVAIAITYLLIGVH